MEKISWDDVQEFVRRLNAREGGQKEPNARGLYDMHGNVWELVQDWHGPYTLAAATGPQGSLSGKYRVSRGGCWGGNADGSRSAIRRLDAPGNRGSCLGFRLLRGIP